MIRGRIALCAQAALALICILGFRNYTETLRHPIGLAERAYTWAAWASLSITGWVFVEVIIMAWPRDETKFGSVQAWKCFAIVILSLLMLLVTHFAVDGMLTRY